MPRRFSAEFKFELVRQLEAGEKRPAQVCREHDLDPKMVREWREKVRKHGAQAFPKSEGNGNGDDAAVSALASAEARIGDLERLVGQLSLENQFLKKALRHVSSPLPRGVN